MWTNELYNIKQNMYHKFYMTVYIHIFKQNIAAN